MAAVAQRNTFRNKENCMKASRILIALMLPLLLSGCATFGTRFGVSSPNTQNANIQISPLRAPDQITTDGARIWKNKQGRIENIKLFSGPVFAFGYDKFGQINQVIE